MESQQGNQHSTLQQILMEVVMKNLQKNEPNIELVRGQDGKFK